MTFWSFSVFDVWNEAIIAGGFIVATGLGNNLEKLRPNSDNIFNIILFINNYKYHRSKFQVKRNTRTTHTNLIKAIWQRRINALQ